MSFVNRMRAAKPMGRSAPQTGPDPTPTQAKADDGLDLLRMSAKRAQGARKALYEKALKNRAKDGI